METVGQKILEIRKRKGLSQEVLSDLAKINLRTLQRIEKGETEPLGNTLKSLCNVLEINVEDILDYGKKEDNKFMLFFHLSVLSFILVPLGNIFIPMILWITKRDKISDLNKQGITLLKFQIIWTLLFSACFISFAFMFVQHSENRSIPLYCAGILILINIIYVIVTSILTSKKGL
jgi:transcriptional regulator with XRE-family HTH domain